MQGRLLRRRGLVTFGVFVLLAEVAGRSLTGRIDARLHVEPFARPDTSYYPFLLAGVKVVGALTIAALLARGLRAWAAADAGRRLLAATGGATTHRSPRLRPRLSVRVWAAAFGASALCYLLQADVESAASGRWPLFAPWLHTYALPVFAVLSVLVAIGWGAVRDWLADVEDYAAATFARAIRILRRSRPLPARRTPPTAERAPRRLFGLAFESRPPPLLA
jgi:hypothetical protein